MNDNARLHGRRDVLRVAFRYGVLGLGGVALSRMVRRGRIGPAGETCVRNGVCAGCPRDETCRLPAAQSRRRARKDMETA